MKRYAYLIIIMFFAFCPNIFASLCSDQEKVNYQNLAKNITSSYSYIEGNNRFNITFTNVPSNFYIRNIESETNYPYQGNETTIGNFIPGLSYKFGIYTTDFNCRDENLFNFYITLPYFNPYYQDSLCSGIENYKYCNKFLPNSISYEQFVNAVNEYRKSLEDKKIEEEKKGTIDIYSYLLEFYLNYYYIILPVIIILALIIRWYYNKKEELF